MATIIEQSIVIRVSKLVRESSDQDLVSLEALHSLEQVAQELLGDSVIVEAERV